MLFRNFIYERKRVSEFMPYVELTGTKRLILEAAILLFSSKNYETVSMKDIGDAVGIKKSSLYAHFTSKQDILDNIYDFFCEYYTKDRPSLEDLKYTIKNGSIIDIFDKILYSFNKSYSDKLVNISKIIETRKYVDERAKQLAYSLMIDNGIQYVEEVFNYTIKIGRIAPLDTHVLGVYLTYTRSCLFQNMLIYPEKWSELVEINNMLTNLAIERIVDLKT